MVHRVQVALLATLAGRTAALGDLGGAGLPEPRERLGEPAD